MTGPASEEPLMSIDIEGYVRKVAQVSKIKALSTEPDQKSQESFQQDESAGEPMLQKNFAKLVLEEGLLIVLTASGVLVIIDFRQQQVLLRKWQENTQVQDMKANPLATTIRAQIIWQDSRPTSGQQKSNLMSIDSSEKSSVLLQTKSVEVPNAKSESQLLKSKKKQYFQEHICNELASDFIERMHPNEEPVAKPGLWRGSSQHFDNFILASGESENEESELSSRSNILLLFTFHHSGGALLLNYDRNMQSVSHLSSSTQERKLFQPKCSELTSSCLDYFVLSDSGKAVLIWSSGTLQVLGVAQEVDQSSEANYVEVQLELNLFARVPLSCATIVNSKTMIVGNEDGSIISFDYSLVLKQGHVSEQQTACVYQHHTLPIAQIAVPKNERHQTSLFLTSDINWQAAIWKMGSVSAPIRVINYAEVGIREWLFMSTLPLGYQVHESNDLANVALYILTEQEKVERVHLQSLPQWNVVGASTISLESHINHLGNTVQKEQLRRVEWPLLLKERVKQLQDVGTERRARNMAKQLFKGMPLFSWLIELKIKRLLITHNADVPLCSSSQPVPLLLSALLSSLQGGKLFPRQSAQYGSLLEHQFRHFLNLKESLADFNCTTDLNYCYLDFLNKGANALLKADQLGERARRNENSESQIGQEFLKTHRFTTTFESSEMSPLPEPLVSRLQESKSVKVVPQLQSKATGTISSMIVQESKSIISLGSPKSRRYKSSKQVISTPKAQDKSKQLTERDVIEQIARSISSPSHVQQTLHPRSHIYVPKTTRSKVPLMKGSTMLQPTTITEEPSLEEMGASTSLQSRIFNISQRQPKTLPISPRSTNTNYGLPYADKIKTIKSKILSPKSVQTRGPSITLPQIKEEKQCIKSGKVFEAIPTAVFIGEEALASEGASSTVRRSRSSIDLEVKLKEMGSSQHQFMRQRNSSQVLIKKLSGRKIQIQSEQDARNSSSNNTEEFKILPLKEKRRVSVDSMVNSKGTMTRAALLTPKTRVPVKQKRSKAFQLTAKVLGEAQTQRIESKLAEWQKMQQLLKYNEVTKKRQERKEKTQTLTTHHIHTSFNMGALKQVEDSRDRGSDQSNQESNGEVQETRKTSEKALEINAENRTRTVFSELVNQKPNASKNLQHTQERRPDSRLGAASNSYYSGRSRLSSPCGTVSGHVLQARLDNEEVPSTFTFGVRETRTGEIMRIPSEEALSYFEQHEEEQSAGVFGALMKTKLFEFGRVKLQSLTPKAALKHVLLQRVPPEVLYEKIKDLPDHQPVTWQTINELAAQLFTFQESKDELILKIQKEKLPEMDPATGWPKDILERRAKFMEDKIVHQKRKRMRDIELRKIREKANLEAFIKYRVLFPLVRKVLYEQSYEEQEQIREDIELMLWQLSQKLGFENSYSRQIQPSSKRKESQLGRLRNAMQRRLGLQRSLIFDSDQEAYTLVQHGQKYGNNEEDQDDENIKDADQYEGKESEDSEGKDYSEQEESESDTSSILGGERTPHSRTRNSALRIAGTQTSHGAKRKASSTRNHRKAKQFTEVRTRSLPLESDQVSNFIRSFNRSSFSLRKRSLYLTHSSSKDLRDREELMQLPSTTRQVISIDLPSSADFPEPDEPGLVRRPSSADQEGSPSRYRNYQIKGKYVFLEGRPILLRKASQQERVEPLSRNEDSVLHSSQHSSSRLRQRMSVSLNLDRMKWSNENETNRKTEGNYDSNSGEQDDEDRYLNLHISPNIVIQKPEEMTPQLSSNSQYSTVKPSQEKKEYRRSTVKRQSTFSEESSLMFDKNKTMVQLTDELSHESDDGGDKRRVKTKRKTRPRGKTVGNKMIDWKHERNKLIKGIKLVSQLSELSEGEDVLTQGDLTLQELVFKQTKRQEKRKKMKELKKSLESSQNSTITHMKHSNSAEPNFKSIPVVSQAQPRLSLFVVSKEPELQEIKAQTIREFQEGNSLREEIELTRSKSKGENRSRSPPKKEGRPTLMTGQKMVGFEAAKNKVEEHFAVIKKRLLQLNKEKFYSLLQSLPKNKPPTQKIVNRALDKIEGSPTHRKFKILSQNTVRVGDSLLEDQEDEIGEPKLSPRREQVQEKPQEPSPPKRISKIPSTVRRGLHKVQFIAALKVMKKKRSKTNVQEQAKADPGFNKLQPPIDLSAIVEKAPPQEIAPSPLNDGPFLKQNSFFNQTDGGGERPQKTLSVMFGSAGSVSHRNESFNTILPGDVLTDQNGSRTIFTGDLRFKDFNRTITSADYHGEIKMNFSENVIRKSMQQDFDQDVSLEVESEVKEELDRRGLFKIQQEKILLKQRAIRRNQAVVMQTKVSKIGGHIKAGTAEKKAEHNLSKKEQIDELKVIPPPRRDPYTQMDQQRSRHIKSSSYLDSNTEGSQRGNILISIGDQEVPERKGSDGPIQHLNLMLREVERQTDVGEGGLNSLKCDLVAKSMEKSHKIMLKNLQKLEEFTMGSRMLAGTPKLQTVSTIQIDEDSKRAGSLFDPVIEAKVEETERTPKRDNLQDQLAAFVNSQEQMVGGQLIPKLRMPPEELRQKIYEYNEQAQELEKMERKYCLLTGKSPDYLKKQTRPLIRSQQSIFESKGLAELLSTPVSPQNLRLSRRTEETKFRERVGSLPTLENVGSLPDQLKSDQKIHRQFSSTLASNRPTTTATNRLIHDPHRKTFRTSTQHLISTSRPNSQGLFSTEAGSTTGGWMSHLQSPSGHHFEQTVRITSTAQTGFRSHLKSSKGFGSTTKSEKKFYPNVPGGKKKAVSRKMGAWF